MNDRPSYFEPIRQNAARRWEQLEADPELAAPWHQLFEQVQSPRHVVSELLQNADDAGATEASVQVHNGVFLFEHNGEDFTGEHFASLCRFGYSNKKTLHTIGFRGIGFKSTFSLGDCVEICTPTLSVAFHRHRFTEPVWVPDNIRADGNTSIRVAIRDEHRQGDVRKNLDEWLTSPLSLLFFRHIRRLKIDEHVVHWLSSGPGPVPASEWVALAGEETEAVLVVRSAAEPFPEDALVEIQQARMLRTEERNDFPQCKIEIVLDSSGRLFAVLPTGVQTDLPFACNAPFIQDPARLRIRDPGTSPTNRWLLQRAGKLAASAMMHWLGMSELPNKNRASAYGLFPKVERSDDSLESVCGTIVQREFQKQIAGRDVLLTERGTVAPALQSVVVSRAILDVWPADQAAALLDEKGRPPFSRHVALDHRKKLVACGLIEAIDREHVLGILRKKHFPKPESWRQLLSLWSYITPEITRCFMPENVRIVPVQGQNVLYSAAEVVRLGERKLLQSENDWQFLAEYLIVMSQNWTRYLAKQRRDAHPEGDTTIQQNVEAAYTVLQKIGLDQASDVNTVVAQAAAKFFTQKKVNLSACVQFAQIAAKFGAKVDHAFRYVTRDLILQTPGSPVLYDEDGKLEELLPEQQRDVRLLHPDYHASFTSCTKEEWRKWVTLGNSGLLTFVPIVKTSREIVGRAKMDEEASRREYRGYPSFPYVTSTFVLEDWDFGEECWHHWSSLASHDQGVWARIWSRILTQLDEYWSRALSARVLQVSTTGSKQEIRTSLVPNWVLRFRELRCLPDTRGILQRPGDLLRRTPQTEPVLDVEPFLDAVWDQKSSFRLLDRLGVHSTPTGPDRILDYLRAFHKSEQPPAQEVDRWYRRLDQMLQSSSTVTSQKIKDAFCSERLILARDGSWATSAGVFLRADEEDVPGVAIVRASVADLTLWVKIGVHERPTPELVIRWLKTLASRQLVPREDVGRIRALLAKHPVRIWEECRHWLNLVGEWTPTNELSFSLTTQTAIEWKHLHPWVKQQTADFGGLHPEVINTPPFSFLPTLATSIENRLQNGCPASGDLDAKPWMTALGTELCRILLDTDEKTYHIRSLARRLARTRCQTTLGLEIIPYINGTPAGTPRQADVVWLDEIFYLRCASKARLAKRVPEELGKSFADPDIQAALVYSYERSPDDIREYVEENFRLVSCDDATPAERHELALMERADSQSEAQAKRLAESAGTQVLVTDAGVTSEDKPSVDGIAAEESVKAREAESSVGEPVLTVRQATIKHDRPSIIERFAMAQGFNKDSDDHFYREDGSQIVHVRGDSFPWQRYSPSGDVVRYYWSRDCRLSRDALELAAEVWGLIQNQSDTHSLILVDGDGEPAEVTGNELLAMCSSGKLKLYPATYRLKYDNDDRP